MAPSLVFSDLSCCEPSHALSHDPAPHQWGVYDYETAALSGRAVYCRPHFSPPPPPLRLPLRARGWSR